MTFRWFYLKHCLQHKIKLVNLREDFKLIFICTTYNTINMRVVHAKFINIKLRKNRMC